MRWEATGATTVAALTGWVIAGVSVSMLFPAAVAVYFGEPVEPFLYSMVVGLLVGLPATRLPKGGDIRSREALALVTFVWLAVPLFGSLPYLFSGTFPTFTDAFFESVSGFTTTGSTVLTDFGQPRSVMMWRQFTQWVGGMGIIVLFIAVLPRLSLGGRQLMEAEAPGPAVEKLTPRIRDTAKLLWGLYVGLTGLEVLLLLGAGLDLYDALAHALTTMPTGGFSPRPRGIAEFGYGVRAIVVAFVFLAGVNFALLYRAATGRPGKLLRDGEFRFYGKVVAAASALLVASHFLWVNGEVVPSLVDGTFQAVTIVTSTGYASADFSVWPGALQGLIFLLMFTGGSAGSTGGGIKMVRILVLLRALKSELSRSLHPRAVISVTLNGKAVGEDVLRGMAAFLVSYLLLFLAGTAAVALISATYGIDVGLVDASTATIATLGNIGPGMGAVGPMENFAFFPPGTKWVLCFLMVAGRLEVLTLLALLTPGFWRGR